MTPRENMLSLYRRNGYAFAPVEFSLCPTLLEKMKAAIGSTTDPADYFGYREGFGRAGLPGPTLKSGPRPDWRKFYPEALHEDTYFTDYGVAMEGGHKDTFHLRRMVHPLASADSLDQLQSYPWPEWDFETTAPMAKVAAEGIAKGLPVFAHMACTIWENAWYVRDMTVLMTDMADGDEKATFILDKITDDSARRAAAFARAGADIICLGDDIGMQSSIMMSMEMYRDWLKPRLKRVIQAAKAVKPDVLIHYHSCGYVKPFIPDLIEAGVDILNPIQPECMDFEQIHAEYGDRLSFNGTLGTQKLMPYGTPDEVRKTTRRYLELAGTKGGLLACPTHVLEPEVPWENVVAYIQACRDFTTCA